MKERRVIERGKKSNKKKFKNKKGGRRRRNNKGRGKSMATELVTVTTVEGDMTSCALQSVLTSSFTPSHKTAANLTPSTIKFSHQTFAKSCGTSRVVSCIPRVAGSGTHRAGQVAFSNMYRGGRMFPPFRI